jgi:Fe2+ transport system protein FeoA
MNLSELNKKCKAVIEGLEDDYLSLLLLERGFIKGTEIELLYSDIFNDVKVFSISGCLICLRKNESKLVKIRLV